MSIVFEKPLYLLLIPLVIVLLIFSMKFMFTRSKKTKIGQIIMRSLVATLLILALSQITLKITGKSVTTIFLLDVSDSVREQKDEVVKFVNDAAKNKSRRDQVGVIAFGSDTRVEQFISKDLSFSSFQATDVDSQATNLEEAVNMALAQMPEDSAKRIVLVTDGNENEGTLKDTASTVISSGAVFQIKKLNENISDEVYVSNMNIPEEAGLDEKFNIQVEVESNVACQATVSLYSGRTLKGQQKVTLQKGTNNFIFQDTQTDEGLKTYRVVVDAEKDTVTVNNEFSAYTNIETELPLLVVEGQPGQSYEFKGILDSIGLEYNVVSPAAVPNTISDLTEYSAVIFIDVFKDDLRKGFIDILDNYVKNYGGGFVATGGANSFALGGYRGTPIEDVLPVNMDLQAEDEIPDLCMCMLIDQSGSMSDGNGIINNLDLAKESAAAAVDNLRETDYVEVIAFDDSYDRVVPLQKCEDPDAIVNRINDIAIDGGTSIYPALLAAVKDVNANDAMVKHIILLTDGQDYFDDYSDLKNTINQAGITVSCVSIGTDCNDSLLETLAEDCGGRYYHTDINTDIPRIFAQEVYLSSNTYLINEQFTPLVTSGDQIIKDVVANGLPDLLGYVATSEKPRSIELLQSPYGDPILSYWQYGLGKTFAWTSDVTGEWSQNYSGWENTQLLWHNIIDVMTHDNAMEGSYVDVKQNGNTATLNYVTESFDGNTTVTATVFDDEGNVTEINMDPTKPGEYSTKIETPGTGIYTINVQQKDKDGNVESAVNTAAIQQYSLEYRFYPENTLLEEYGSTIGAAFLDLPSEVFAEKPEFVRNRFNLSTLLLILAAILFILDIAIRRYHVNFDGIFGRRKKKVKPVEEIGNLKTFSADESSAMSKKEAKAAAKAAKKAEKAEKAGSLKKDEPVSNTDSRKGSLVSENDDAAATEKDEPYVSPFAEAAKKAENQPAPPPEALRRKQPQKTRTAPTNIYAQMNQSRNSKVYEAGGNANRPQQGMGPGVNPGRPMGPGVNQGRPMGPGTNPGRPMGPGVNNANSTKVWTRNDK